MDIKEVRTKARLDKKGFEPQLIIPTSFAECLSYEQQVLFLNYMKQNKLVEGENITLIPNEDGTVTISASGSGFDTTYEIEETTPASGYVAAYILRNINTEEQAGVTIQIPAGEKGDKGDKGDTGATGVGITSITFDEEVAGGNKYNVNLSDGTSYSIVAPVGPQGITGATGVGISSITFDQVVSGGNQYNVNLSNGTSYPIVAPKGNDGQNGVDGVDGVDGDDGVGISSITFDEEVVGGNQYDVNLTDGTSYPIVAPRGADGQNGTNGTNGTNGVGIATITFDQEVQTGNQYDVNLTDGTSYQIVTPKGDKGDTGATGVTGENGNIIWYTTTAPIENGGYWYFDTMSWVYGSSIITPTSIRTKVGDFIIQHIQTGSPKHTYLYRIEELDSSRLAKCSRLADLQGATGTGVPAITATTDQGKVLKIDTNDDPYWGEDLHTDYYRLMPADTSGNPVNVTYKDTTNATGTLGTKIFNEPNYINAKCKLIFTDSSFGINVYSWELNNAGTQTESLPPKPFMASNYIFKNITVTAVPANDIMELTAQYTKSLDTLAPNTPIPVASLEDPFFGLMMNTGALKCVIVNNTTGKRYDGTGIVQFSMASATNNCVITLDVGALIPANELTVNDVLDIYLI